jgi:hypothetical protein
MGDSRDDQHHYVKHDWLLREALQLGSQNVLAYPLVSPSKIILPLLHIKLGLMKNFVKALKEGRASTFLRRKFPRVSDAKLKNGIFDGPQIRELMQDAQFGKSLDRKENKAWLSLKSIVKKFLGNHRSEEYEKVVEDLLSSFHAY